MLRPVVKTDTPVMRRGGVGALVVALVSLALVLTCSPSSGRAAPAASGGNGWRSIASVPGGAVNAVCFTDALRGWAVNAGVLATTDGGVTWGAQTAGSWTLQDVTSTTSNGLTQGWAVGADAGGQRGIIAGSTPAGTWVERVSYTGMSLKAVDFGDHSTGYAVGAKGAIVATADGGDKWAVQSAPGAWDLRDVAVTSTPAVFLASVLMPVRVFAVGLDPKTQNGVVVTSSTGGGWAERASFAGAALNALSFPDTEHGWAVGDRGSIVATIDGGASWTLQEPGGFWDLEGVTFVDAARGWAVGAGVVLATADGGATWKVQGTSATWDLRDVVFTDALHGYAAGLDAQTSRGVILATSNGGVPAPAGPSITSFAPATGVEGTVVTIVGTGFTGATAVAFNGASAAFTVTADTQIAATVPAGATSGRISVTGPGGTADSGADFSVAAVPLPVPTVTGFSPASGPVGTVVTVTGAGFWKGATVAFNGTPAPGVVVASVTQITTAVPAGATSGPIVVTTPGGTGASTASFTVTPAGAGGWGAQFSGTTETLRSVASTDVSHSWAVGGGGTVVASTDGGQTWSVQDTGTEVELRDVVFVSPSASGGASADGRLRTAGSATVDGWAVGEKGTILVTGNGGGKWEVQDAGTTSDLSGVAFTGGSRGWAVGDGGTILTTSSGGTAWSTQDSSSDADLGDVTFTDGSRGWAVGDGGTILATTDGGSKWSAQRSGTGASLSSISFPDALHGWAVGSGGTILATKNGGGLWRLQTTGTTADLRGVTFVNATVGWVVGSNGTILITKNGGATWTAQRSLASTMLLSIRFPDALHGWVVGANGTILFTQTGGSHPTPRISSLKPVSGRRGTTVTITGASFGATQGLGFVRFGARKCSGYVSWSAARIVCKVPAKAKVGKVKVTVTTPLGKSNAKTFRVKP
jgi:photosystem II stability/assembly factor-like uncharacterized protein